MIKTQRDSFSPKLPSWYGASRIYDRGRMILDYLWDNGYEPDKQSPFKAKTLVNKDMAILMAALEAGQESEVRAAVTKHLNYLTVQQLAETSR
ncbi:hypothetical protein ACELLULO517_24490 [Acidisoma cellulosilytica]|uniref:Uncharacterized protein n=1 Tax=Acidisoma cellulosilyticum TaxID=2802395 RepID=A0A963Z5W5_9PROT|nr:hypothetical protein [Acidisoma cellulosilyticum]MCB8883429.1 hypothetical protein [Acidisoma cellulosilyticum]